MPPSLHGIGSWLSSIDPSPDETTVIEEPAASTSGQIDMAHAGALSETQRAIAPTAFIAAKFLRFTISPISLRASWRILVISM